MLALAASVLTYVLVENPIRHAKVLLRIRWGSLGLGAALTASALGVVTFQSEAAIGAGIGRAVSKAPASSARGSPRAAQRGPASGGGV